ncbi:MAG: ABC-F family ATP-binding cassette domain-containing protein [Hyphomicrobiales bacterium]
MQILDLTYRIEGRLILDHATATIPAGHKVGLVGRNGAGKSTLLKLALGELHADDGAITLPRSARIGTVAQEAPGGEETLLETVLAADTERASLMAEAEHASDPHRIAEIQMRLADIDAHAAPSRAATILSGLGLTDEQIAGPCSALSGGWRMRVALAAGLFANPDVLLLDEPTNYLDLEGVIWLKSYLRTYRATVIVVSHDRDLLNDVVDSILHLDRGKLTLYQGNYDSFERQREEKQALSAALRKKQEAQKKHMEAFVERFRYKASKARQAQSRLKALAKLQPIAEVVEDRSVSLHFPNPERALNPPIIRFEDAVAAYDPARPVLKRLNLRIDPDDRIALLGSNGNGKSTFAKLLTGRLAPVGGEVRRDGRLKVGYFAQHQLDELDGARTPYDYIRDLMPDQTDAKRRAKLGAYGFGATHADTEIGKLSGGEKARLLLALATYHRPHLLVLDEPTNHLDIDAREALVVALNEYEGAVVLISHDRHLVETSADRLWVVSGGTVTPFDGDLDAYADAVMNRVRGAPATEPPRRAEAPLPEKAAPRANLATLRKKLATVTTAIDDLTRKIAVLDKALEDPALYAQDAKKAADFAKLRTKLADDLAQREHDWLVLNDDIAAHATAAQG